MHTQSFYWQPNLQNSKKTYKTHTYMHNITITNNLKLQRTLKQSNGDPNYYSAWSDKLQNSMHYLQHWTTQPVIQLSDTIRESTAVHADARLSSWWRPSSLSAVNLSTPWLHVRSQHTMPWLRCCTASPNCFCCKIHTHALNRCLFWNNDH